MTTTGSDRSNDLQEAILELGQFPLTPEAAWIEKVKAAPVEVLAGAILCWRSGGGISNVTDPHISRREAAQAILQTRLTEQTINTMVKLDTSTTRLTRVGIALGVIGTFAGVIQAIAALKALIT